MWNKKTQENFFDTLYASEFFNARQPPNDKAFSARDRITRSPKALGFVDLRPTIQLTKAGAALLSGRRTSDIFAKQLLKFQLPSPYHPIKPERGFNVRPYLELLRMVSELGSISKQEIAIFFVQLKDFNDFKDVKDAILQFRDDATKTTKNRDIFRETVFEAELKKVFATEIAAGDFDTRESDDDTLEKFLATKRSNQIDYADAFMRYLRSTQLVTFEKKTFRLIINPDRVEEVDYILNNVDRGAYTFKNETEFKKYLFDPGVIELLSDDPDYLTARLRQINVAPPTYASIEELQDFVEQAEEKKTEEVIREAEVSLKEYHEFDDVMEIFDKIRNKTIVAPSLFLEWNVWRGLAMINDAKKITGNFKLDLDGMPLVMESESVPRHFGDKQRGNNIPAYCIFVAPAISPGTLAYFFNLNKIPTDYYGGKTRIVPMTIAQYSDFLTIARDNKLSDSQVLKAFFDEIFDHNQTAQGENTWASFVTERIPSWASA